MRKIDKSLLTSIPSATKQQLLDNIVQDYNLHKSLSSDCAIQYVMTNDEKCRNQSLYAKARCDVLRDILISLDELSLLKNG